MPGYMWLSVGILIGLCGGHVAGWLMTRNERDRPLVIRRASIDQIIESALGKPPAQQERGRHSA